MRALRHHCRRQGSARHCHVNRAGLMEPRAILPRRSCCASGACLLVPDLESVRTDRAIGYGRYEVLAWMEVAEDERERKGSSALARRT